MNLLNYIEQKLNRPDLGLLVLRVVFGLVIFIFGIQKLMGGGAMFEHIGGALAMFGITWQPKLWGLLSALTETFGGLAIILGVFFRPAALLLIGNMVVATVANAKMTGAVDTSSVMAFAVWLGKVAIPVYYLGAFLALFFTGPGKYAVRKGGGGGGGRSGGKSRE